MGNSLAMAWAMAWACSGLGSRTATSMSTVSGGVVAVTWLAMSPVTPTASATGARMRGVVSSCAYDLTRCWVKVLPWSRAPLSSDPVVDTKNWVRDS